MPFSPNRMGTSSPDARTHDLKLLPKGRILVDVLLVLARKLLEAHLERLHHSRDVAEVFLRGSLADSLIRLCQNNGDDGSIIASSPQAVWSGYAAISV